MMGHRLGWIMVVIGLMALLLAACAAPESEPAAEMAPSATEAPAEKEVLAEEAAPASEIEAPAAEEESAEEGEAESEEEEAAVDAPAEEAPAEEAPAEEADAEEEPLDDAEAEFEEEEAAEEAPAEEAPAEDAPAEEADAEEEPLDDVAATPAPATATLAPIATTIRVTPSPGPVTPTPILEERLVELEWPSWMRLGDSDLVRLSLIPAEEGYVVTTEFEEHDIVTESVEVKIDPGYDLFGVARLDSTKFDVSPSAQQEQPITLGQEVTWRWTISPHNAGQHRMAVQLLLRWVPQDRDSGQVRESTIYDKGLTVDVSSFLGLTIQQATASGMAGLVLGSSLTLPLALYVLRPRRRLLFQAVAPNKSLVIEQNPTIDLSPQEESLLQALFHSYARLTLKAEFRSGYSGARIFLILPVREGGRADAFTIAKLGESTDIEQEFYNYETFVKHTLPPITARILDQPITLSSVTGKRFLLSAGPLTKRFVAPADDLAALRYTFIGEAGRMPTSLRQALLADPKPELLERLFLTFGPNWWMQRRPYTFQLAQEYDRMLPSHYMLEPAEADEPQGTLDGHNPPAAHSLQIGEVVTLRHLKVVERREDHGYLSLRGQIIPGNPPLRLRLYMPNKTQLRTLSDPDGTTVRVTATRESLLRDFVSGFNLYGLPDPLPRVRTLFNEQLFGTQSPIHGDLNLENVLIGLGDFVWLIDFALTREGHPLYDFAHLEANIIAHVLAPRTPSAAAYLELLRSNNNPLLTTLHSIAARCLFNPNQVREYHLALFATCIGALKYRNLDGYQKHLLYLTAAYVAESL